MKATLAGIRRTIGTAQASKVGISIEELRRMVAACDQATRAGLRDRALLVLAVADAFRRSDLVSLGGASGPGSAGCTIREKAFLICPPKSLNARAFLYSAEGSLLRMQT